MAKTYSAASADLLKRIERMQAEHHPDLEKVTIGALFVFDDEKSDSVLKHQGYPAAAVVRITPLKDRALGLPDAQIVVDRLRAFQAGPYSCRENALALTKLEEAQHWLHARTRGRMSKGIEGTHAIDAPRQDER